MIVFRADGNANIGAGHIMRCLSIAYAAKQAGEECVFITASDEFETVITAQGHTNHIMNTDYRYMEKEDILPVLVSYQPSVLFVDSYYVTQRYLTQLKEYCDKRSITLVYIDDVLMFPYPCHKLLNYNIYGNAADYAGLYSGYEMPEFLLGPQYAPLRQEFQHVPKRCVKENGRNVLVSTGGADSEHMALELLNAAKEHHLNFHFVIGSLNKDKESIRKNAAGYDNIVLHENVSAMSELMESCDVAISAAGSTLYELCATQTPTVTYVLADNQIPGAEGFSSRGIMMNCGDVRALGNRELARRLIDAVAFLSDDYEERARIAELMGIVVDGRGAERIINIVLNRE